MDICFCWLCHSQNLVPNSGAQFFSCCFSLPALSPFSGLWPALLSWKIVTQSCPLCLLLLQKPHCCVKKLLLLPLGSNHKDKGHLASVIWNIFLFYKFTILLGDAPDDYDTLSTSATHFSQLHHSGSLPFPLLSPSFLSPSPRY